jgi:glycosyltransferase involved in cell wall biosynthesis
MKGILQHGFDLTAISPAGEKHAVIMLSSGNPQMAGGVPTQALNRADYLNSVGISATIICRGSREWSGLQKVNGVDVVAVSPKDFKLGRWIAKQWFHPLLAPGQREALEVLHRKKPIDFILFIDSQCAYAAIPFGTRYGVPSAHSIQGTALMPAVLPPLLRRQSLRWERYAYQNANFSLPASLTLLGEYERAFGPARQYEVLYNAIDDVFQPVDRASRPVTTFGFVGRLEHDKRPLAMIEATKLIDVPTDWRFRIIGEGSLRRKIEEAIANHPYKSQFKLSDGFVSSRGELAREYGDMDCLVWSSEVEGLGVAPAEAMATGLPVVGPNIVPGRELLGDDYPALADVDDFKAIALRMQQMATDPALVSECRQRGLAISAKFRPEVTMTRLAEIIRMGEL